MLSAVMILSSTGPVIATTSLPSGGLMLFSVTLGLLLAIAFQAVLANLGIAIGLSVARPLLKQGDDEPVDLDDSAKLEDEQTEAFVSQKQVLSAVGVLAGLSMLMTIDSVLFGASFLAVRFSRLAQPIGGITLGLAIWAVYILLLLSLGSSALGSTAELLLGGAITSLRQLLELVSQVLRSPPTETPSLEQKQLIATFNKQLENLQDEISNLTLQTSQSEQASSLPIVPLPSSVSTPQSLPKQHVHRQDNAISKASQISPSSAVKAAAMSQAVALTSTAQTAVMDSWQQVKDQVRQQVDEGATALLSNLNEQVQTQAQQTLEQVDLSDYSLTQLWEWVRQKGSEDDDDISSPQNLGQGSEAQRTEPEKNLSDQSFGKSSSPSNSVPNPEVEVSPQIAQVNRDLKNYLKYTSLEKLNTATLNQKIDELFSTWLNAGERAENSESQPAVPLQAFAWEQWEQALQSRKGIQPAQLKQYKAVIEQRLVAIAAVENTSAAGSDGLVMGLKTKLKPLLEQTKISELSLEDFKQLLMQLTAGEDVAESLSEKLKLRDLDFSIIAPSNLLSSIKDSALSSQELPTPASPPLAQKQPTALENPIVTTHEASPHSKTETKQDAAVDSTETDFSDMRAEALHGLTERAQQLFTQLDDSLRQSIEASADFLPTAHPLQYLRDRLPTLQDGLFSQLTDFPDHTSEQIQLWIEETQTQFDEQIQQAQAALSDGLQAFQHQAMEQAEQVRHWAAIAAWWLFGLTLSSAIAAGTAGYWAVTSPLLRSLAAG